MVDLELERSHRRVKVDPVEIAKKKDLRVSLSSVSGLGPLARLADLDDDHVAARDATRSNVSEGEGDKGGSERASQLTEQRDPQTHTAPSTPFRN